MSDPDASPHPSDEGPHGLATPAAAQREALEAAAVALEQSVAAPTAEASWRGGVEEAVRRVQDLLSRHIARSDSPEGLPGSIEQAAPGLAGPARRLSSEHHELADRAASLQGLLDDPDSAPEAIRDAGADLSGRLIAHVHAANDLVVDAFEAELGDD